MRVVRTDRELELSRVDMALQEAGHEVVLLPDAVGEDALCDAVGEADLLLMCYTPVTARVITAAKRLRGIVKYGVGIDAIDMPAAMARGIPVVNIPAYADNTVAEGAFALMLALARRLPGLGRQMQAEGWAWPAPRWLGRDIARSTVGVVGLGRIGRAFARMAGAGFGARVLGHDPHVSDHICAEAGVTRCTDLHAMLGDCDFVSLHCVLNDETRGLIGAPELGAMKPTAILINTARGALVDEAALIRALDEGWIGGAGLDVFRDEPLTRRGHALSALYGRDTVILTPHLSFWTEAALERLETETLARCREILEGRPVRVNSDDPRLRAQRAGVRFPE